MRNRIKEENGDTSKGIKPLCPTRWTVKANAMKSILDNYAAVIQTFENDVKDSKSMPIGKSNY